MNTQYIFFNMKKIILILIKFEFQIILFEYISCKNTNLIAIRIIFRFIYRR